MISRLKNIFFVMLLFAFVSCENGTELELKSDKALLNKISAVIKTSDGKDISLKEITDFEWDKVCICKAYELPDTINARIGYDWELSKLAYNRLGDDVTLLIFTKNGRVVKYLFFPCRRGNFSGLTKTCYRKVDAVFKVIKSEAEGAWYEIEDR